MEMYSCIVVVGSDHSKIKINKSQLKRTIKKERKKARNKGRKKNIKPSSSNH